jgi:hypothetical protein
MDADTDTDTDADTDADTDDDDDDDGTLISTSTSGIGPSMSIPKSAMPKSTRSTSEITSNIPPIKRREVMGLFPAGG